jgi:predicted GNAT family acetyltransferase
MQNIEFPDAAGYPDGSGILDEGESLPLSGVQFTVVDDAQRGELQAISGDEQLAAITYVRSGHRLTVEHTFVWPDYRGQGIADELIRRAFHLWATINLSITIHCPIAQRFVDTHPEFAQLVESR